MRGEWIEIVHQKDQVAEPECLSPCGESGLKFIALHYFDLL